MFIGIYLCLYIHIKYTFKKRRQSQHCVASNSFVPPPSPPGRTEPGTHQLPACPRRQCPLLVASMGGCVTS